MTAIPPLVNSTVLYYGEEDPVVRWPLLVHPAFVAGVTSTYLLFVKVIGPRFMADRKPYSLKSILLFYNLTMVLLNVGLVMEYLDVYGRHGLFGLAYFWNHSCHPLDKATNPQMILFLTGAFHYYLTKICDLVDTVFFVMRKKQNQITFLHLFHHTSMVVSTWLSLYLIREEIGALLGVINTIVHVVMYAYYFLAALGPSIQKYLWWKRYITQMQILQFVIIISIIAWLSVNSCDLDPMFRYVWGTNTAIFLGLFINFYVHSYSK